MAPTLRSIWPAMITKVMPTAMIAKKLVSLASWVRFSALRNLFTRCLAAMRFPSASSVNTLWRSPLGPVSKRGRSTDPPKRVSNAPNTRTTTSSPASASRRCFEETMELTPRRLGFCLKTGRVPRFRWTRMAVEAGAHPFGVRGCSAQSFIKGHCVGAFPLARTISRVVPVHS